MPQFTNWPMRDWLLVITLVGGFFVFFCGVGLMIAGTNAEGMIDLKSSVLSGTIRTGSAGLFVCVFGVALIITPLVLGLQDRSTQPPVHVRRSPKESIGKLLFGLAIGFILCVVLAGLTSDGASNAMIGGAFLFGALMVPSVLTFLWREE